MHFTSKFGELHSFHFKSSRPLADDVAPSSTGFPETMRFLKENAEMMRGIERLRFYAIGYTDDVECTGTECDVLALRRAQLVARWLLTLGVPAETLQAPKSGGRYFGTNYVPSDGERTIARRVDIGVGTNR